MVSLYKTKSKDQVKRYVAEYNRTTPRSGIEVVLSCDWEQEHAVVAEFRDGVLVSPNRE